METKVDACQWQADERGTWLRVLVQNGQEARAYAQANADKPLRLKLTKWREKRSHTANSYAWILLGKLSEKLHIPPEDIYRNLIRDVGGNYTAVKVAATACESLRRNWEANGIGWVSEVLGAAGPGMLDVLLYYGSSQYDSAQMGRLIDLIIEECRQQDIEYLTPQELSMMLDDWSQTR